MSTLPRSAQSVRSDQVSARSCRLISRRIAQDNSCPVSRDQTIAHPQVRKTAASIKSLEAFSAAHCDRHRRERRIFAGMSWQNVGQCATHACFSLQTRAQVCIASNRHNVLAKCHVANLLSTCMKHDIMVLGAIESVACHQLCHLVPLIR